VFKTNKQNTLIHHRNTLYHWRISIVENYDQAKQFLYDLKKLLDMVIPGMNKEARDTLLLHLITETNNEQLRALGEVKTLKAAITHSRLLMTIDSQSVSAVKEVPK